MGAAPWMSSPAPLDRVANTADSVIGTRIVDGEALMHGKATHGFSIRSGISGDVYVGRALIDMYAKCGRSKRLVLFWIGCTRNLVSLNVILVGLSGLRYANLDWFIGNRFKRPLAEDLIKAGAKFIQAIQTNTMKSVPEQKYI
ncbi:hypothetical protein RHMOL_Rhmol10G0282200 [Rhododendron molle]|uniref:Uncharacterized protein n=1 Tax=Rhododendron molle TaxID=49168 RepID=A0ACC0M789_RHOML|nr:hypothetical protein RHMOL_Rhmol10G0282200 [Rhododendron molle]